MNQTAEGAANRIVRSIQPKPAPHASGPSAALNAPLYQPSSVHEEKK
ncbi:hypothetical protein ABZX85_32155 [Streptomyces sp. NPDC004539]